MSVTISIEKDELSTEIVRKLQKDLCRALDGEIPEPQPSHKPGTKGDVVSIGTIILALITSGTALAIVNALRALVDRDSALKFHVTRGDGKVFDLDAKRLSKKDYANTLRNLETFLLNEQEK